MKFPVLWSGLVSRVGASDRVNLMHLSPLDRNAQENCYDYDYLSQFVSEIFPPWTEMPKKIAMTMTISANLYQKCLIPCSTSLLNVSHNLNLTARLPRQHTGFQSSPMLKAFLAALGVPL